MERKPLTSPLLAVDHLVVFDQDPEAAVRPFVDAGFSQRPPRVHVGQGSRNQSVQLSPSIFLEFLCVHDATEAAANPMQLQRYCAPDACPIGIAWRTQTPPLQTWRYDPPYAIPAEIWVANHVRVDAKRPLEFALVRAQADPVAASECRLRLSSYGRFSPMGCAHWSGAPKIEIALEGARVVETDLVNVRPL